MSIDGYILGIDIGTSSVRALLYDANGDALPGVGLQTVYAPEAGADGSLTVDPDHLFDLLCDVLDAVSQQLTRHDYQPVAVGISCFWHSLIALDSSNQPLTPVLLWGDTRSEAVITDLAAKVDVDRLHQATGCILHSSYWPAKVTWLFQTSIDIRKRTVRLISFAEYAAFRLFGIFSVSISMASGTGLLSTRLCTWDEHALSLLPEGTERCLSPIDEAPTGDLARNFAARWPRLNRMPWFPAFGDGGCANIGATGLRSGHSFVVTVGTSAAIRSVSTGPGDEKLPGSLFRYRLDHARTVIGGALSEGGNLIAWLETVLRLPPVAEAEQAVAGRVPDAGNLTVLPFIAGERSPDWTPGARASFVGVTLATQPIDFLQASMESIGYELRHVFDDLAATLSEPGVVLATGAAMARSPVWTQILANVLARPLQLAGEIESSSLGAALMAMERLGMAPPAVHKHPGATFLPDHADAYSLARQRQDSLRRRRT